MLERVNLPLTYSEFSESETEYHLSANVLDPVVFVEPDKSGSFLVRLGAVRFYKGAEQILYAPSIDHDYVLDKATIFPLPSDIKQEIVQLFGNADLSGLSISDILLAKKQKDSLIELNISDGVLVSGKERAELFSSDYEISPLLKAELYPYQRSGVAWLANTVANNGGALLADEMGLGKTVQVIATILGMSPTSSEPVLIICPTSLIANWVAEIEKFAPTLTICIHRGSERAGIAASLLKAEVIVSTYDTVVIDEMLLGSINWRSIICDEAQALKNPDSNRRIVISNMAADSRILMTGTPVETSLVDAWSLLDICVPGILGEQLEFEDHFPDTDEAATELNDLIGPLMLRRTVSDVAKDLPERIDVELPLDLDEDSAFEYEKIRSEALEEYGIAGGLVATARLSVFCAYPRFQTPRSDAADFEETRFLPMSHTRLTPKLEITKTLIKEASLEGKKVLIFSNYNHIGEILKQTCANENIAYWESINGETVQERRQEIIGEFSAVSGCAVLVLNPKAAGAGLNITAATIVIHYTPVWNPALEMQASARAHRRGQTLPVSVYQLFYKDTVEEVMVERARMRKGLGNRVMPSFSDEADIKRALDTTPVK